MPRGGVPARRPLTEESVLSLLAEWQLCQCWDRHVSSSAVPNQASRATYHASRRCTWSASTTARMTLHTSATARKSVATYRPSAILAARRALSLGRLERRAWGLLALWPGAGAFCGGAVVSLPQPWQSRIPCVGWWQWGHAVGTPESWAIGADHPTTPLWALSSRPVKSTGLIP